MDLSGIQNGLSVKVTRCTDVVIFNVNIAIILVGALQAEPTQRLNELSRPKRLAEGHEASRDGYWRVTNGAKSAVASSRYAVYSDNLSFLSS